MESLGRQEKLLYDNGIFNGRIYGIKDLRGNSLASSHNLNTNLLIASMYKNDSKKEEITYYSLDNEDNLFYENPQRLITRPGSFEVVQNCSNDDGLIKAIPAEFLPSSIESREAMLKHFMIDSLAFSQKQHRLFGTVLRLGRNLFLEGRIFDAPILDV